MSFRNREKLLILLTRLDPEVELRALAFDCNIDDCAGLSGTRLLMYIVRWLEGRRQEDRLLDWLSRHRLDLYNTGAADGSFALEDPVRLHRDLEAELDAFRQKTEEDIRLLNHKLDQMYQQVQDGPQVKRLVELVSLRSEYEQSEIDRRLREEKADEHTP